MNKTKRAFKVLDCIEILTTEVETLFKDDEYEKCRELKNICDKLLEFEKKMKR